MALFIKAILCEIPGLRRGADEAFTLLGCYAAYVGGLGTALPLKCDR